MVNDFYGYAQGGSGDYRWDFEQYQQQRRYANAVQQMQLDMYASDQKALGRERARIWGQEQRLLRKEEYEEGKRAIYEEIEIDDDGAVYVKTCNLHHEAPKRPLTNGILPLVETFCSAENEADFIYNLSFMIRGKRRHVFLRPEQISSGAYLLRKFAQSGIEILVSESKAKEYARLMVRNLVKEVEEHILIPTKYGWLLYEGKCRYVKRGETLWKDIQKLAK